MSPRPHVLLSVATSLDGYIDDNSSRRLLLSNDNPRLFVQSESRRRQRLDTGLGATPIKVTFSVTRDLDPAAHFFTTGDIDKLVYTPTNRQEPLIEELGRVATVVDAGNRSRWRLCWRIVKCDASWSKGAV